MTPIEIRHFHLFVGLGGGAKGFNGASPRVGKQWWQILGVPSTATKEAIQTAYRKLASEAHPDKGGSVERMAEINRARDEGLQS
jgi:DnaJ-domain-containing protein 1